MVAATHSLQNYGILSVVFHLYTGTALPIYCSSVKCRFKIPPTLFYPRPKVDSALLGLHFLGPAALRKRLAGVCPKDLRRVVVTATFLQRRNKTVRNNSLKKRCREIAMSDSSFSSNDDDDAVERRVGAILNAASLPLPAVIQQAAADSGNDSFAQKQALPVNGATKLFNSKPMIYAQSTTPVAE